MLQSDPERVLSLCERLVAAPLAPEQQTTVQRTLLLPPHVATLLRLHEARAAALLVPAAGGLDALLSALPDELQLRLLRGLVRVQEDRAQQQREEGEEGVSGIPPSLTLTGAHEERYVALLCVLAPHEVYAFLQSDAHTHYRLDATLRLVQLHPLPGAQAFLLEKMGNFQEAVALYLREVEVSLSPPPPPTPSPPPHRLGLGQCAGSRGACPHPSRALP